MENDNQNGSDPQANPNEPTVSTRTNPENENTNPTNPSESSGSPPAPAKPEEENTLNQILSGIAGLTERLENAETPPPKSVAQEMEDLKNLSVDTAFVNDSFNTLAGLPFDKLIGEPLRAAVKAQRDMAKEALSYIKDEAIQVDKKGVGQLSYVTLNFIREGKEAQMRIPLLTLIPYPSLSITSMTYKFTASIDATSGLTVSAGNAPASGESGSESKPGSTGTPPKSENKSTGSVEKSLSSTTGKKSSDKTTMAASYSSKQGSSATRDSRYSVETTIDLTITASNQEPPVGITKIMDVLDSSTEVVNTDGELHISAEQLTLTGGHAVLSASYRDSDGTFHREKITCAPLDKGKAPSLLTSGDDVLFIFSEAGTYVVNAGIFNRVIFVT